MKKCYAASAMFTGIIQETGKVLKITKNVSEKTIVIQTVKIAQKLKKGDSIAVNGVCLTITKKEKNRLECDIVEETLQKTNLEKTEGKRVNLESPLSFGDAVSGHYVLGHVDEKGKIKKIKKQGKSAEITIGFPKNLEKYIAKKGSIAVNGVSFTIAKKSKNTFEIAVIPYTLRETNLGDLKKNDEVNLEVDLFARYLETLIKK